ncbi:type II 3-dehydroquinate dehydratase [Nisaea sp.]|uniref:type II 3-dehydroquinate dehydratase n=1 Tax=Nisaea sp. TaxID=2024842 RepID=UPI003B52A8C6
MTHTIHILNGPNLNKLGKREPTIYGRTTLEQVEGWCREAARGPIEFRQSNHEGTLIDMIHEAEDAADGLIINPAGLSFQSVPLLDALKIFEGPKIELHISNIHARDALHRHSIMSPAVTAVICGLGPRGYVTALGAMYDLLEAAD